MSQPLPDTTVYIVVVNDSHTDPVPSPFTDLQVAIGHADTEAERNAGPGNYVEEDHRAAGWLYCLVYGDDNADCIFIVERKVNQPAWT